MEDIKLNTAYRKVQYYVSWVVFILLGMIWAWITVLFLMSYGKTTSDNVKDKEGVLNKSWQKFVYIYGQIGTVVVILIWLLALLGIL